MRWVRESRDRAKDRLGPAWFGALDTLGSLIGIAVALQVTAMAISPEDLSAELFWTLAQVGAGLFVAYSVALVGLGPRVDDPEHKNWLGSICALGVAGVSAIGLSLLLATSWEAGHSGWVDITGLCWIAANFVLMGLTIALLPLIASSWRESATED